MWKNRFPAIFLLLSCLLLLLVSAGGATHVTAADSDAADIWPTDQIIIKFKETADTNLYLRTEDTAALTTLSEAAGVPLTYVRAMSGDAHVLKLEAPYSAIAASVFASSLSKSFNSSNFKAC